MKNIKIALAIFLLCILAACGGGDNKNSQGNSASELNQAITPFSGFAKAISVFGVGIHATAATPDYALFHAATVMAEYLDNDEDGVVDNAAVVNAIKSSGATVVMFASEDDEENTNFELSSPLTVALYAFEVHPSGAESGQFDATLEEVLHLITSAGYALAYPNEFGEGPGSVLANAMDNARGGFFEGVPSEYPWGAWYTYEDYSCDYNCMVAEYIYWALTSVLGAQDFAGRFEEIRDEWRLNTAAKVQSGDPAVFSLITNQAFALPTVLPNGVYTAGAFNIVS